MFFFLIYGCFEITGVQRYAIGVENKAHSWVEGIMFSFMKFMKFFTLVRLKEHTELIIIRRNVGVKCMFYI